MRHTTLVIMAAGIGSRFGGGIKQLEPVGPGGEIIMDYSVYDALEAGFDKIIFVIRKDLEKDFKQMIGNRIEKIAPVFYAYQELDDLPEGFQKPEGRTKPWGTGQAILAVRDLVEEPFLVINADDYYGKEGFRRIHRYMVEEMNIDARPNGATDTAVTAAKAKGRTTDTAMTAATGVYDICMGGFILSNTLSENGGVTRGVCRIDDDGTLKEVTETYNIHREGQALYGEDEEGKPVQIPPDCHVSMNMWGFPPSFIEELKHGFPRFLESLEPEDVKSEYLLPKIVDEMVRTGRAKVTVLETRDQWFGVTYREDKATVVRAIRELIASGVYPEKL